MNIYEGQPVINDPRYEKYTRFQGSVPGQQLNSRPVMVICETINICCNNCVICSYGNMQRKKEIMPLDLFEKVLTDYSEMGGGTLSLTPVTGEVLLDNRLIERLQMISSYPLIKGVSFTTNGVPADLFTDNQLRFITDTAIKIHVSMYGMDEDEHRALTGKHHFRRAVRSIARLIELTEDRSRIVVGFRFLSPRDDSSVKAWMQQNWGTVLPYGAGSEYCDWQDASERCDKKLGVRWYRNTGGNTGQCFFPMVVSQVYCNGDVSFCKHQTDIDPEHYLGNLRDASLAEIFNSEKNRQLWRFEERVPAICRKCMGSSYWYRPIEALQKDTSIYFENPLDLIGA